MGTPDDSFVSACGVVRISRFGPVFAGIYEAPLNAEAFDAARRWQAAVMPDTRIIHFSLAFGAQRLAPQVQAAADRLIHAFADRTCLAATVLKADGFQAATARTMLATIYLVSRVPYPRRVFGEVEDAASWLLGQHGDAQSIRAAARWYASTVEDRTLRRAG